MRSRDQSRAGRLARAVLRSRDESGFTMVEMIVAILVFAILIVGVTATMSTSLNMVRNDRNRSVAANLASQEMDTVRSTDSTDLPIGQTVTVQNVDTVPYTITRETEWVTKNASSGACDAPPGSRPAYLRVNVEVTWPSMNGIPPVDAHTILTPPVGAYDPNSGHIAVKVVDRDGFGEGGISVAIAGPQNSSQLTNSDGCAFFAFIPAGTYTVTASAGGYVDLQGVASPSQPASVVVGATTSVQFQYDRAATLQLTMAGSVFGSAAPSSLTISLYNTHILPAGVASFPGSGNPRTISGRFPYADGYEVWAGDCAEADPAGYPGGSRTTVAVDPGAVTSATVLLPEIRITVQQDLGGGTMAPVPGKQVNAVGCGGADNFSIGQTDATGQIVFALPYGTWQISVDGGSVYLGTVPLVPGTDPGDGDGSWPYDISVTTT